ncbi:sugar phosphate isomerase/epimerase family protein [Planococcus sp. 4-30]|uniref:sugar phosphate isomerase/epimerase family protein n=1 Tax=Planococcus sp. 4-30 TaxID=2874583 RepID=UPI001CBD4B05|nr:sugar phosphate isomerase/epimerase family protein [Planococcus sp. 4-30]
MAKQLTFLPTILMPEIYRPFIENESFFVSKIEGIAEEGFYKGIEIAGIHDKANRQKISEITSSAGLIVTQWMTAVITEKGLDLSAVNQKSRQYAVSEIIKNIALAKETGASTIALITGPDPGEGQREKAAESLVQSLKEICTEARACGLEVIVEPLDRHVHKKMFLGPSAETASILSEVKESHPNIGFAFDTAHAALNGEQMEEALEIASSLISQLHLSNAVLDNRHPIYGDYHIPLGEPGFLTYPKAVGIVKKAESLGIFTGKSFRISVEVRTNENEDAHYTERVAKEFLKKLLAEEM